MYLDENRCSADVDSMYLLSDQVKRTVPLSAEERKALLTHFPILPGCFFTTREGSQIKIHRYLPLFHGVGTKPWSGLKSHPNRRGMNVFNVQLPTGYLLLQMCSINFSVYCSLNISLENLFLDEDSLYYFGELIG